MLWGINFLFFQSIRIMYCRFELCLWPFLSISFLKAVLVYPKNIFVILNFQLNADGGLTSMTVSRSLEGCFQHRWPTMDNFLSNNKQLGVQQWMKSPIMDTYYGEPGWIKLRSFNFLIICSRVNRIMTWWGMFVRTRVRFWRWKKCWNCYCLFDNL